MTEGLAREILGVSRYATKAVLRSRWRALARLHHPDRGGDPENFKKAAEAYQVLMDTGNSPPNPSGIIMISGPTPKRVQPVYVNPWYWEEQEWLEQEFGHLGFWTRKGMRR